MPLHAISSASTCTSHILGSMNTFGIHKVRRSSHASPSRCLLTQCHRLDVYWRNITTSMFIDATCHHKRHNLHRLCRLPQSGPTTVEVAYCWASTGMCARARFTASLLTRMPTCRCVTRPDVRVFALFESKGVIKYRLFFQYPFSTTLVPFIKRDKV